MKPTIYVSNWASRRTPGQHGTGRAFTIMARPNPAYGQCGEGRVPWLTPADSDLLAVKAGRITGDEYQRRFEAYLRPLAERGDLAPGKLFASIANFGGRPVLDGDTVCCACSKAVAAAGRCHRVWAAHALARQGWRVILDGEELVVDGG